MDFDPTATNASCLAEVYTLAGFVTRMRPVPNYTLALEYYQASRPGPRSC